MKIGHKPLEVNIENDDIEAGAQTKMIASVASQKDSYVVDKSADAATPIDVQAVYENSAREVPKKELSKTRLKNQSLGGNKPFNRIQDISK